MMHGAAVAALCLLLIAPPSTLHLKQGDLHSPLAAPHQQELRGDEETAPLDAKQTCRCDLNRSCTLELRICCVLTAVCVFGPRQTTPWTKVMPKWVSSSLHASGPLP